VATSRGDIRDRNGQALALSVPSISFFIDPMYWSTASADALEPFFGHEIAGKFKGNLPGRFHWVMRKVPQDIAKQVIAMKIPGLFTIRESHRMYPHSELASHVIGFCDVDDFGLSGIEREWNKALFSPPQNRFFVRDARGNLLDMLGSNAGMFDTGAGSVKLTLDSKIQQIVEWKLRDGAEKYNAQWGAGVCVNPQTGEIYAMASYPMVDLNDRSSFKNQEMLKNNVTGRVYEPGATFKPILLGIAKEMGVVSDNFRFTCTKRIRVADGVIGDVSAHGNLTLEGLLIKSCNTGMAFIGNDKQMIPYDTWGRLKQFGFGAKSGVELSGEEEGLLRNPEEWLGVTKANVAIGQGLAVTPLQLAMGISAIANGGQLLKPYIVAEVKNSNGEIIHQGQRRIRNSVLNAQTAKWLRQTLYKTVEEGTGKEARINGIPVAGKTGTAQLASSGAYVKGRYASSFVGFWPYEKPEYLLLIVLGEPKGTKYYGGEIAAPVFKAVVEDMVQLSLLANASSGGGNENRGK
jgi:cell division protein FtsI (penicillin-binding protein 3)/stage V sporulation protein D (sporulation-specific penicillin-binding protein)